MGDWKDYLPEWLGGNPKDYGTKVNAGTPHCSKYSNAEVRKMGKGVVGDAWNRYPDKGYKVKTIIDGFKYTKDQRPEQYESGKYRKYLSNSADSVKKYIDLTKLQNGDLVSMYYKGSPNEKKAFNQGKVAPSTHTGHILFENDIPYVMHNVGGKVIKNKASDITGGDHNWGITQVRRVTK